VNTVFSQRINLYREPMSAVHEPVQDSVGKRVIADAVVPLISGQLADDQC
jgi:hypothetical protein